MAKKKINIVLIIVVIALWGAVFYKTVYKYFSSQETFANETYTAQNVKFNQIHKDTFALETITRDPFLNKQTQQVVIPAQKQYSAVTSTAVKKTAAPIAKTRQLTIWPAISYHGYIKDSKGELVIMKIDNKMYRLRKDALIDGIALKKITRDSLELDFNRERKIIARFKI
ncbi:hypothetical protein [Flavobacterium johnsoniae]|jgi:hypothetical protein|uniref:Uncharacterized protein n=1 Tax=Flavobacterium johnsoniae (strain ATCC 17061 / DSM 2064 / JCM 8514 / BCRC 14874 / CCUG 350202 / NBRC 14942 / NCIMB 11054 / UW101) TaxID=376686 RepID=A5FMB8_FLAJ1|nr:hypothetical protein [Flavobacterium johnsoniae]ABQ03657.1 hypothetical protein Fjoh_0622 [Flavobacterium johnsoniae UW101]OXE95170.1 hypothetical protein B0A63_25345 [Flavobacterium johnsoniae UW101]WQG79482.1 hypothetical protein SR927_15775 [Flavobacterium johnsoniae UW101]SHJ99004.1 hypothetical protein SAMN05444146_0018 [Flavobacterium johnsoniae]